MQLHSHCVSCDYTLEETKATTRELNLLDPSYCGPRQGQGNAINAGPSLNALNVLQFNVEGLPATEHSVLENIASQHNVGVIYLQETHVNSLISNQFRISVFNLINYSLHEKYGKATYVRSNLADVETLLSISDYCDIIRIHQFKMANIYTHTHTHPICYGLLLLYHHLSFMPSMLESSIAITNTWGCTECDQSEIDLANLTSLNELHLLHDSKQPATFHSAHWDQGYSLTSAGSFLLETDSVSATFMVLGNFPKSSTAASSFN